LRNQGFCKAFIATHSLSRFFDSEGEAKKAKGQMAFLLTFLPLFALFASFVVLLRDPSRAHARNQTLFKADCARWA
jgi:hypothetical protein